MSERTRIGADIGDVCLFVVFMPVRVGIGLYTALSSARAPSWGVLQSQWGVLQRVDAMSEHGRLVYLRSVTHESPRL